VIQLAIAFVVLLLIGVPIAFALGLAGVVGILANGLDLANVPRRMFTAVDSFVLLAAPFYILAGEIMNRGGITERLIRLSMWITGKVRGGTAYANIVASVLFAGISGTAIADTAALGQVFIKGMPKEGYTRQFAAAVTVASSMIGPIVPPSVIMVIYAAVARISVIQLFLAGILPGLLMGLACAVVVWIHGRRHGLPVSTLTVPRREIPKLALDGLLVASLPGFIIVGTVSGVFTATEAGGIAVIYAVLLGLFVFRHLRGRDIVEALVTTGRTTATLFIVIACVAVASYVLTLTGGASATRELGVVFAEHPVLFMLAVAVVLLILGAVIDPGVQVLLIAPLLLPIARSMGIDDLQFSMVLLLAGNLALITPPVGVILFVACRIGDIGVWTMFRAVFPFLIAEFLVVLLIALVPEISTLIPDMLYR